METELMISLEANPGPAPEWLQLLPLGEVSLGDGRAPFSVDQEALEAMVNHFQARGLDLVIDYEHQTLSGHKAPAAGWIKDLEARDDGLWAKVEWTDAARSHLGAREYRYFSPVLRLAQDSRRPVALLHAALTNTPAMDRLAPLVAKDRGQGSGARGQESGVSGHDNDRGQGPGISPVGRALPNSSQPPAVGNQPVGRESEAHPAISQGCALRTESSQPSAVCKKLVVKKI